MVLTKERINEILSEAKDNGLMLKVKDIAYIILTKNIADKEYAYRVCFPDSKSFSDRTIKTYEKSEGHKYLLDILDKKDSEVKKGSDDDITFEENKAYMLKLKRDIEDAIERKEIDKKDGYKILADISTRLNDKFNVQQNDVQQQIIVNSKYSSVCSYCGHECAPMPMTKEQAKKKYNLVEADKKY